MGENSITLELRRFIANHIQSVEQLEVLCVLFADPNRSFSISEVLHRVQSSEKSVADCLDAFRAAGFLAVEPGGKYRFAPANEPVKDLVGKLIQTYRERRVSVIECIYARASDTIQDFADAFRLRKDKEK